MKTLLLLVFLSFSSSLIGQNPSWHVFHGPLQIRDVAFEGDDVWIATPPLGVVRMDKNTGEWENFSSLNAPFTNNRLTDVEVDAQGRVWMGLNDYYGKGRAVEVYDHGSWTVISNLPDGTPIISTEISKDCNGDIWIATHYYNDTSHVFSIENLVWTERTNEFRKQVPLSHCSGMTNLEQWWGDGIFLKRKDDGGIFSFQIPDSLQVTHTEGNDPFTVFFYRMIPITRFPNGKVLIHIYYRGVSGFDTVFFDKFVVFDGQQWSVFSSPPFVDGYISWDYIIGGDGSLYVLRAEGDKVFRLDGENAIEIILPGLYNFGEYPSLWEVDTEGNFWISKWSPNGGMNLSKFNQSGGVSFPSFSNSTIEILKEGKVISNKRGEIWYYADGTLTKISQHDWVDFDVNQLGSAPPPSQNKYVQKIFMDWNGNPWITLTPNIYCFECDYFTPLRWDGSQWKECEHIFRSITFAPNNVYWYTDANYQLHRRIGTSDQIFDHSNTPILPESGLRELSIDSESTLWLIGLNGHVFTFTLGGQWAEIPDVTTYSLYENKRVLHPGVEGDMWLRNDYKIWYFDGVGWTLWALEYDQYYSLEPVGKSLAWISHRDGLVKWDGLANEKIDIIGAEEHYNIADDIAIDTFGNMWLATGYGLVVYNENGLQIDTYLTPTHEPSPTRLANFLSPNPFGETAQVDMKKIDFTPTQLRVYNAQGVLVQSQNIQNQETSQIKRNSLPPGLYFVLVEGEGKSVVGKLVAK